MIFAIFQTIMNSLFAEKILKYLIYLGVVILLYVPFVVAGDLLPNLFFPYITGKAYIFRIVTELIFGLWLVLAILNPIYRPRKSWIVWAFVAFLVSIFISAITGSSFQASFWSNFERMEGWITMIHLFALMIALGCVLRDKREWIWLFNTSIVFSLFMVVSAFGQISENGFNTRVDTTLGNSTYLGIYMLVNAFLSLFLLLREKIDLKKFLPWFYIVSFVLQVVVVFQTGTRGSMLGFLGGLILMAILLLFLNWKGESQKMFRKISIYVFVAVVVFIGLVFLFKDSNFIQNIQPLKRITTISISEGTAQARIINWKIALEGFKERPILGWGQSNFNYVFDKYYLPEHYGNENWFDRVHNIFFDWLIAGGIFGLLFYLSIWVALLWAVFVTKNLTNTEKSVFVALLSAYFFHNLFVFDQIVSYIYFVFFLAFIYSQTSIEFSTLQKTLSDRTKTVLISLVIILIPIIAWSVNYQNYMANLELFKAVQMFKKVDEQLVFFYPNGIDENIEYYKKALSRNTFGNPEIRQRIMVVSEDLIRIQGITNEDKQEFLNFSINEAFNQIKDRPNDSRHWYFAGVLLAQLGQFDVAQEQLLKAIDLSPKKQAVRAPLIQVYVATEQKEKALELAKETYELDTSKNDLWSEYVRVASGFNKELSDKLIDEAFESGDVGYARLDNLLKGNINRNPKNVQNWVSLSAYYFRLGDIETSLAVLEKAKQNFPDSTKQIQELQDKIVKGENPAK